MNTSTRRRFDRATAGTGSQEFILHIAGRDVIGITRGWGLQHWSREEHEVGCEI